MPMPCSPDSVPPRSSVALNSSASAASTRACERGVAPGLVRQQVDVQVAVAGVAERRRLQIVARADRVDAPEHLGDRARRHHDVLRLLELVAPRAAPTEQTRRVFHSRSRSASSRAMITSRAPSASHTAPHASTAASIPSGSPSSSTSTIAPASAGKRVRRLRAHVIDRRLVEQLERARPVALADDRADRAPRRHRVGHHRDERPDALRAADQAHRDLAGDAERALAADEQRGQVVAGDALRRAPPEAQRLAAHQRRRQAERPVARDAVLERARAARVLGDVAADRAERRGWPDRAGRTAPRASTAACRSPVMTPGSTTATRSCDVRSR